MIYEEYKDEKGRFHREDGPARNFPSGEYWYIHGKLHREDGPAAKNFHTMEFFWYYNGKLHREDGPARQCLLTGIEMWYKHGEKHNRNGYAILWGNKDKEWWINGKLIKFILNGILYNRKTIPCRTCIIRPLCEFDFCEKYDGMERYGIEWFYKKRC